MKKNIFIATAVIVAMAIPLTVFAATSEAPAAKSVRGFFTSKVNLTEQQKADAKDYAQKSIELKKEYINKMVANGAMTQEQADAAIKKLEEFDQKAGMNGWMPGFDKSKAIEKAKEFFKDHKSRSEFGNRGAEGIKLNDQQKADLVDSQKKMIGLQKELVAKMAANGAISQEKANEITKRMDEMAQKMQEKGLSVVMGIPMAGFGGFGEGVGFLKMQGLDPTKLNEQQKADLTEYANKMDALRKETIAKMVASGAITQEQADAINKKMEDMHKFDQNKAPFKERGMMERGMFNKGCIDKGPMGRGPMDKGPMDKGMMQKGRFGSQEKPAAPSVPSANQ